MEEAKADVMGVYNILYMIQRGELREDLREKSLVTYVAGLFRSIRFFIKFIDILLDFYRVCLDSVWLSPTGGAPLSSLTRSSMTGR